MKTVAGIFASLFILLVVALLCASAFSAEPMRPGEPAIPEHPLSAIAVTQCGGALALFIQLDPNHLLRADPRQSDLFTNVNGHMVQSTAAPMKWDDAYELATRAVITTHVLVPCERQEATT